jgi:hypothetical protein
VKKVDNEIKVIKEPVKEISLVKKVENEVPILIEKFKSSTSITIQRSKPEANKIEFVEDVEALWRIFR